MCFPVLYLIYIPDDVLFILDAPSFGAAGFAPLPRDEKGFGAAVGGGAAMASQRSSSAPDFRFNDDLDDDFGIGAATEPQGSSSSVPALLAFAVVGFDAVLGAGLPHRSLSSSLFTLAVLFGLELETEQKCDKTHKMEFYNSIVKNHAQYLHIIVES